MEIYKILDEFFQKIQYIDLRTRFLLIQSTTDISNTINTSKNLLAKQRERFFALLKESQASLKEDINNLKEQIKNLMKFKSIDEL